MKCSATFVLNGPDLKEHNDRDVSSAHCVGRYANLCRREMHEELPSGTHLEIKDTEMNYSVRW